MNNHWWAILFWQPALLAVRILKKCLHLIGCRHCLVDNFPTGCFDKSWLNNGLLLNGPATAWILAEQAGMAKMWVIYGQLNVEDSWGLQKVFCFFNNCYQHWQKGPMLFSRAATQCYTMLKDNLIQYQIVFCSTIKFTPKTCSTTSQVCSTAP